MLGRVVRVLVLGAVLSVLGGNVAAAVAVGTTAGGVVQPDGHSWCC
jgi:hypothetical protein